MSPLPFDGFIGEYKVQGNRASSLEIIRTRRDPNTISEQYEWYKAGSTYPIHYGRSINTENYENERLIAKVFTRRSQGRIHETVINRHSDNRNLYIPKTIPQIHSLYPSYLPENNLSVRNIRSSDYRPFDMHTYELVGPPGINNYFRVSGNRLIQKKPFNFEANKKAQIFLKATDRVGNTAVKDVSLNIGNQKWEAIDKITSSEESFDENLAVGTRISTLSARDSGDYTIPGKFKLVGEEANQKFGINNNANGTSHIFVRHVPDYELVNQYSLQIQSIPPSPQFTSTINFRVNDLPEAEKPIQDFLFNLNISEEDQNIRLNLAISVSKQLGSIKSVQALYWLKNGKQEWLSLHKDSSSNTFSVVKNLGQFASSGEYEIRALRIVDDQQEVHSFSTHQLNKYDIETSTNLVNPNGDGDPPILNSLEVGEAIYSDQQIKIPITLSATDSESGLDSRFIVELTSPQGQSLQRRFELTDGSFDGHFILPSQSSSGQYRVNTIRLNDNAGNNTLSLAYLQNNPQAIDIQNDNGDNKKPELTQFSISIESSDDSFDNPILKVKGTADDSQSGVKGVYLRLRPPTGPGTIDRWIYYNHKGTPNASFDKNYSLPSNTPEGEYSIDFLMLNDIAGNHSYLKGDDLENLGFNSSITHKLPSSDESSDYRVGTSDPKNTSISPPTTPVSSPAKHQPEVLTAKNIYSAIARLSNKRKRSFILRESDNLPVFSNILISGSSSNNVIKGTPSNDIITGGPGGRNRLRGRKGSDAFLFTDSFSRKITKILDFSTHDGDQIWLSAQDIGIDKLKVTRTFSEKGFLDALDSKKNVIVHHSFDSVAIHVRPKVLDGVRSEFNEIAVLSNVSLIADEQLHLI